MSNWKAIQEEIIESGNVFDVVRRRHLAKLHKYTERNVIAYYSGWLSNEPSVDASIIDDDKNGFMMCIHGLNKKQGLDLMLHTPGGDIAATESLVNYLRVVFDDDIRVIVPHVSMSAGTMIACSAKQIIMGKQSNLGPIDPQIRGAAVNAIIEDVKKACDEISEDQKYYIKWQPILSQLSPGFITQCEEAINWAKEFVETQLKEVMFSDDPDKEAKANKIVEYLSSFNDHKTHSKHIHMEKCKEIGLNVLELESDQSLQDLVLSVHHCFNHTLSNTNAIKIIENHTGNSCYIKRI
ncbi:MAG: serine protease [Legionellales bacterium]|nr:serine protease [Legionellales bacterium]